MLTMYVFAVQFIVGIVSTCIVVPYPHSVAPATKNIDHPSRPWRIFYRVMTLFMCNLFSWLLTAVLLAVLFGEVDHRGLSDIWRATLLALMPVPLLIVLYWLFAKAVRKKARDMSNAHT
ncbi:hypothetical protein SAMN05216588_12114 [Pseudomonas flavescens]|uniref:Uncharacterized protein n=1 Tax=Phytopseudomonas flavescens TaxID=29435 RepID=A0A1G8M9F8_9GAMM|nr:hypothetical protein [Pseudomonas flavescens]SDI64477.1 hypothetical protein SAMN05216588_12114 [Pseudomonas flavescens]